MPAILSPKVSLTNCSLALLAQVIKFLVKLFLSEDLAPQLPYVMFCHSITDMTQMNHVRKTFLSPVE